MPIFRQLKQIAWALTITPALLQVQSLPALAEKSDIKIAAQHGVGFLPLMIMQHEKLIEKHLKAHGAKDTKVDWVVAGGGASANEALISGAADLVSGGASPLLTIWNKTQNNYKIRGVANVSSLASELITNRAEVHSISDLSDKDKIAMPAAKVGVQAIFLQMAAAKAFGADNWSKLDQLTVSLPNPEALVALTSGQSSITGHLSGPPFPQMEKKNPALHSILSSDDVLGGPGVLVALYCTTKFHDENPILYKSVLEALKEAHEMIGSQPKRAAEIYVEMSRSKESVDFISQILDDPKHPWTTTPFAMMKVAEFMHKTGRLETMPNSWKDLFFPEVHNEAGN